MPPNPQGWSFPSLLPAPGAFLATAIFPGVKAAALQSRLCLVPEPRSLPCLLLPDNCKSFLFYCENKSLTARSSSSDKALVISIVDIPESASQQGRGCRGKGFIQPSERCLSLQDFL